MHTWESFIEECCPDDESRQFLKALAGSALGLEESIDESRKDA